MKQTYFKIFFPIAALAFPLLPQNAGASNPSPPAWNGEPGQVRHLYTFPTNSMEPVPDESDNPFGESGAVVALGEFAAGWQDPNLEPAQIAGAPEHGAWDLGKGPAGIIHVTVPIGEVAANEKFISYGVDLQVNATGYTTITDLPSIAAVGYSLTNVTEFDSLAFEDPILGQWEKRTWTARINDVVEDYVTFAIVADQESGTLLDTIEIYAIAEIQGEFIDVDVTIDDLWQTYDGQPKEVTVTTEPEGPAYTVTYDGDSTAPTVAGSYEVVVTVIEDFYVGAATNTLTVDPAPLTIKANDVSKIYGQPDPHLTWTIISGELFAGDTPPTGELMRDYGENAGTYAIGQGTLTVSANYDLSFVDGIFTISQAEPDITWPTAKTMLIGKTLAEVELLGGEADVAGEFVFADPGIVPPAGPVEYSLNFTPDDQNYSIVSQNIAVTRVIATHSVIEDGGFPGNVVTVEKTFDYPETWTLSALACAVELPAGWKIQEGSISGDGEHAVVGNDILFTGSMPVGRPISYTYNVIIGEKTTAGTYEWGVDIQFYGGGYEPGYTRADPDPIALDIYILDEYLGKVQHGSRGFYSPSAFMGPMTVTNIFQAVGKLKFLEWAPDLPDGWKLVEAGGDEGNPAADGHVITFEVDPNWPQDKKIEFWYTVDVPGNAAVIQSIGAETIFETEAMPQTGSYKLEKTTVYRYHSTDFKKPYRKFGSSEILHVIAYWRRGGYRHSAHPQSLDGFIPYDGEDEMPAGEGRHSADYEGKAGSIGVFEANRVLAIWRNGGYSVNVDDPEFMDGYRLGIDGEGPRTVKTDFPAMVEMTLDAKGYTPGQFLTVKAKIYAENLLGLAWIPELPSGWRIISVQGCGNPELGQNDSAVLWVGHLPEDAPAILEMTLDVPIWEYRDIMLSGTSDIYVRGQNASLKRPAQTEIFSYVDLNHDGVPDVFNSMEEFITTKIPLNISDIRHDNKTVTLRWTAGRGRVFTVEYAESFGDEYQTIEGEYSVIEIDPDTVEIVFTHDGMAKAGYYRVRARIPPD